MPRSLDHDNARRTDEDARRIDEHALRIDEDAVYRANLRLNKAEYALRRLHLRSMPRYLSIVIGNDCNINCPHCYQVKTGDNLMRPPEIGEELRRELTAFYPYLSTLRIQGGEVFIIDGFEALLDDIASTIDRPVLSISTNGTLIDETWAERIVRTPFQSITVSIDGAEPETYAKLRRGADLKRVLDNVRRIGKWKSRLGSSLPKLDFFYLLMRSNFREIPRFIEISKDLGIPKTTFQTIVVDERNLSREPTLTEEVISDPGEVRELYDIIRRVVEEEREHFELINISGLRSLFEENGLDTAFIREETFSLYPDNEGVDLNPNTISRECLECLAMAGEGSREEARAVGAEPAAGENTDEISLCPNPWTLMFITEYGNVHTCFMATPVGNLYETPLVRLWNSPMAISARGLMSSGRYGEAGCSGLWCSWREGRRLDALADLNRGEMIHRFREMVDAALAKPLHAGDEVVESTSIIGAVRRMLTERDRRITELEWHLSDLCEKNRRMLEEADRRRQEPESAPGVGCGAPPPRESNPGERLDGNTPGPDVPGSDHPPPVSPFKTTARKAMVRGAMALSARLDRLKRGLDRLAMKN